MGAQVEEFTKPTLGRRSADGYRIGEWHQNVSKTDETVRAARALREEGKTYAQIGKVLGVPWPTIRDWVTDRTRSDA